MAEKEQFKLLHNLNIAIETAAYLDVGREWEKMVESFTYYRLYYVRSGSGTLVLTNKTIELEEGYMYFIPAFSVLGGTCNALGHYFIHMIPDATTAHLLKILAVKEKCPLEKSIADYLFTTIAQNCKKKHIELRVFRGQRAEVSPFPSDLKRNSFGVSPVFFLK